ncbi:ABC transporter [Streptomyces sp. NPDC046831]|uniref:ABC transporter n=1 Tax=Streptomyces sp. NPDC046831 TaxID=3154805 RepID=UPI0033E13169
MRRRVTAAVAGSGRRTAPGRTAERARGEDLAPTPGPVREGGRLRVVGALVRPTWHALPWPALAGAGALGLVLAAAVRLQGREAGAAAGLVLLRLVALVGGLGVARLLDDPARHTTAAVPVRRPVRAGLRAALVAPFAGAWWAAAVLLVPAPARPPAGALTLEAAAIAACASALAAAAVRLGTTARPGERTALTLLALAAAVLLVPRRWSLLVAPEDPNWAPAHAGWAAVLVLAAFTWALCLPEPLRRRPVPRRRSAVGGSGA